MKTKIILILLFLCCITAFSQEKHPYIYGINNASMNFQERGIPEVGWRIKYVIVKPSPSRQPNIVNSDYAYTSSDILNVSKDFTLNNKSDTYFTIEDIPCGQWAIGYMYLADVKNQWWPGRAMNRVFSNNSKFININMNKDE